ncbi:TRAP transporter substrate-binding protein [Bacillus sp. FJAT-45350]|uniref:TRAP transporter substrate-binding protein n=1 Tax=Bacillus sp. FJAT-45350 TaxID=2011014 RepID=UPI000BB8DB70|nr:TRAP transporter substrate-binding protein [Bacillus sp. FJAT-45350]
MKKWIRNILFGILPGVILLGACGSDDVGNTNGTDSPQSKETNGINEHVIKASAPSPERHPLSQGLAKFAEIIEEKSDGKMKVELYYGGTLGDERQVIESLQGGIQEAAISSTGPLYAVSKEFGIFDLPFIFNSGEEADVVLDGPVGQGLLNNLSQHNLIGLSFAENGFRSVTNSKHAIQSVEDFKGLKIRTMQNEIHLEIYRALGANPTPMGFSEVFSALESKAIDGTDATTPMVDHEKLYEVQTNFSLTNYVYNPAIIILSKHFWDKLTEQERSIVQEAANEASLYQREVNRAMEEETIEYLTKDNLIEVNELSLEEREKMQELTQPIVDKYSKEIGEDLVNEFIEEINKLRN